MSEKPQAQRKQTAAEVAEQLRASMHADRQLITNAQQEAKEDARRAVLIIATLCALCALASLKGCP